MPKYQIRLTTELITKLLKGVKLENIYNGNLRIIILPPQDGIFFTYEEIDKIISDRTNMTERLLAIMESKKELPS